MPRPIEHECAIAAFAGGSDIHHVEPAVAEMHGGAAGQAADTRRVEHFDADANARRRLRIDALTNGLWRTRGRATHSENDSGNGDQQRDHHRRPEDQATSFHKETVSG
jgi:hypothetical protein